MPLNRVRPMQPLQVSARLNPRRCVGPSKERCGDRKVRLPVYCLVWGWYNVGMSMTILDRIIEPFIECLTQEAARKIVALRADDEMQGRVDELADKANAGTLSEAEQSEYDRYLAAFHFVTILQARARRIIQS